MNDDQMTDLKQFIDARLSQTEQALRTEMDERFDGLEQKMDDGFAGVGDTIEQIHKRLDEHEATVDGRLGKLELRAA